VNLFEEAFQLLFLVELQLRRMGPYWVAGTIVGSLVSVFLSERISAAMSRPRRGRAAAPLGCAVASLLGAASPVCMFGTIPLIASLARGGVGQHILVSFMVSSILINPNLFAFSFALGAPIALLRLGACLAAGIVAGLASRALFKGREIFDLGAYESSGGDSGGRVRERSFRAFGASLLRGLYKTAPYFLAGIALTALFDRYFPREWTAESLSPRGGLGPIIAASVGVPLYLCGGGTIPLIAEALRAGMSPGSALAFMISGPATKLTNLGAVKILLGKRNFALYLAYNLAFAIVAGLATDAVLGILK
jgi:uncharacterized membrane protein YraQ (UPF0718 family)